MLEMTTFLFCDMPPMQMLTACSPNIYICLSVQVNKGVEMVGDAGTYRLPVTRDIVSGSG